MLQKRLQFSVHEGSSGCMEIPVAQKGNPVNRVQDHPAKVGGNLFLRLEMQGDGIDAITQTGRLIECVIEHMA